jgi:hypothetical protein
MEQLRRIASASNFVSQSADLTNAWNAAGVGPEAIEPVLQFMEVHPAVDFGTPGPLVHFIERFRGRGYEEVLVQSIHRRPTAHTLWMLNRLINAAPSGDMRQKWVALMNSAITNPAAHDAAVQRTKHFSERIGR